MKEEFEQLNERLYVLSSEIHVRVKPLAARV